jgi:hypothetical protein
VASAFFTSSPMRLHPTSVMPSCDVIKLLWVRLGFAILLKVWKRVRGRRRLSSATRISPWQRYTLGEGDVWALVGPYHERAIGGVRSIPTLQTKKPTNQPTDRPTDRPTKQMAAYTHPSTDMHTHTHTHTHMKKTINISVYAHALSSWFRESLCLPA